MSSFFIERPIFAWVLAILIMLAGVAAIVRLPVDRYPEIAPPSVEIDASYPGASAQTVEDSVTKVIEQNMTSLDGLQYMVSTSDHNGSVSVTLTFSSGTNPDTAQLQVQNKLLQAAPLLPQAVQQQGISVSKANSGYLMVLGFYSEDDRMNAGDIGDYVAANVIDPVGRVPGVGSTQLFGSKYAMRIWLDADKLNAYGLTPADVATAVKAQNSQVAVGELGGLPAAPGQQLNATVTALGRLSTPEQFRNIVLGSNSGGATLRLADVARVELGQADYTVAVRYNGKPAAGMGITLANGANALSAVQGVRTLLDKMKPRLPPGVKAVVPFDTTPYVRESIKDVARTLVEAVVLVFLVMLLFLQNLRATLIPTIAVPVVLLGTLAVLAVAGMSINMLTLFAMVLAIGLLVDDAIVVVENVERLMSEEGLSPVEATQRTMKQITGALVGIASVLCAVFVPMAFMSGSVGVIYRQFAVRIVSAMVLSALVAILRPVDPSRPPTRNRFFARFNRHFDSGSRRYQRIVAHMLGRPGRYLALYAALAAAMGVEFFRLPTAFLPDEDQSYLFALVKGPVGATQERTLKVLDQVGSYFLDKEGEATASVFTIAGFSFGGGGQNAGFGFVGLKDWSQREAERLGVTALQDRAGQALSEIKDAQVFAFAPPPVLELGTSSGFDFYLQDDFGQGHEALTAARDKFLALAAKSKLLSGVRAAGQDDAPQFHLEIDAQKAGSLGLSMNDVNDALAMAWGGRYIDDFVDRGRVKRVIVQADARFRMLPEDFGRWFVRNSHGDMVSMSSFATSRWDFASPRLERYSGTGAMEINGDASPGVSSGEAMKEVERLVAQLPPGFSASFTGQSFEERAAGAQTPILYALSLVFVFLWLAAMYESWSLPAAILLAAPLGIIGAVLATALRGLESDIYFQVAMLTTIGLSCKNAILVVEFAKKKVETGVPLIDATLRAVRDRLRPILMTSLAFGFGVLPLAAATGAGGGAQRAIGTGVFGGMVAGTFLGIFFIPLLFVAVQQPRRAGWRRLAKRAAPAMSASIVESTSHGA
jgi:multidrug efflux pump